jgi:hypothetical protein
MHLATAKGGPLYRKAEATDISGPSTSWRIADPEGTKSEKRIIHNTPFVIAARELLRDFDAWSLKLILELSCPFLKDPSIYCCFSFESTRSIFTTYLSDSS